MPPDQTIMCSNGQNLQHAGDSANTDTYGHARWPLSRKLATEAAAARRGPDSMLTASKTKEGQIDRVNIPRGPCQNKPAGSSCNAAAYLHTRSSRCTDAAEAVNTPPVEVHISKSTPARASATTPSPPLAALCDTFRLWIDANRIANQTVLPPNRLPRPKLTPKP